LSPKGAVTEEGGINQEFFKPKKVLYVIDKKWGEAEKAKLYQARAARSRQPVPPPPRLLPLTRAAQGIETYGLGMWQEIRAKLLPEVRAACPVGCVLRALLRRCPSRLTPRQWDVLALRVKAQRLMGCQSLDRYGKGGKWKWDKATVDAEHAANFAIGQATGCWKSGVLVENSAGAVKAALAARDAPGPSRP